MRIENVDFFEFVELSAGRHVAMKQSLDVLVCLSVNKKQAILFF